MKTIFLPIMVCLMVGCTTVPVKQAFPDAPKALMEKPTPMKVIPQDATADLTFATVIENYGIATDYKIKLEAWQKWYTTQKQIFDK